MSQGSVYILNGATVTGGGTKHPPRGIKRSFQALGTTSSGAGSATIRVEASNLSSPTENDWIELGTILLTLATTSSTDGFTTDAPWLFVRGNVTAISGTGATVSLIMGG